MKKFLQTLFIALLSATASFGATIGYTNGSYNRFQNFHYGDGNKQGLAIRLPHEKLALLKGKQLTGIESIFGSAKISGTLTAFVSKGLDETPLAKTEYKMSTSDASSMTAKWKTISFDSPYTITGEEECLYVGYYATTSSAATAMLSMDGSYDLEGCTYSIYKDKWVDMYGTNRGCANLKAVVDEIPSLTDVVMKRSFFDGYFMTGNSYTLWGQIYNFGTEEINSFDVEVFTGSTQTLHFEGLSIKPGTTYDFTLPEIYAATSGSIVMSMEAKNINGKSDADDSDNKYAHKVFFYEQGMERSLLVEVFTGQACSNCPYGHATMNSVLGSTAHKVVEVVHHAGYYPDNFTMDEDMQYTLFYGSSGTYAPAFMVNRYPVAGNGGVVQEISKSSANDALDLAGSLSPYASLKLESEYDAATREVKVKFHVLTHEEMPGAENVLNIMLVQDGLKDTQSNGGNDYAHNRACRGTVTNNAWGLKADFTPGLVVTYEKTFTLPDAIRSSYWTEKLLKEAGKTEADITKPAVAEDMYLVAYVGRYHESDPGLNDVYNCVQVKLGESYTQHAFTPGTSGIKGVEDNGSEAIGIGVRDGRVVIDGRADSIQIFDTTGRQHDTAASLPAGMYIVKAKSGAKTVTKKIMVR